MKYVLQPEPHQSRANCIKAIQEAPNGYVVEISEPAKEKTDLQTRALFGVAYPPIMAAMGLQGAKEKEEIHEYFLGEFFGWQEYQILNKRKVKLVRTTTTNEAGKRAKISTVEMAEFWVAMLSGYEFFHTPTKGSRLYGWMLGQCGFVFVWYDDVKKR